jgi:glutamate-5-semialdehyde dehydrogenase
MTKLIDKAVEARLASYKLARLSSDDKNSALNEMADKIWENRERIIEANQLDLKAAEGMLEEGLINQAMIKRLALDKEKVKNIADMIRSVGVLDDPIGETQTATRLDTGLDLYRVTSPIGVVAVIFESRPDALTQIASLCLKSGNCVMLKGGREARNTNHVLYDLIKETTGLPDGWIQLLEDREEVAELLGLDTYVDLVIPRGSNKFVRYIQDNTRIPVLGHADGVCHIFVDREADIQMALDICLDAKIQYPSVCNAVDCILVHREVAVSLIPLMVKMFHENNVEVYGCNQVKEIMGEEANVPLVENWRTEYLDYKVSLKILNSGEEAIDHINTYGSHHTDAVITSDYQTARLFLESVDSANVFWNASTRFADGYRYGLGSEVGISTGKIHARGPTGLEGLTSYKYILVGCGQKVGDYAGDKAVRFKHESIDGQWRSFVAKSGKSNA